MRGVPVKNRILPILCSSVLVVVVLTLIRSASPPLAFADTSHCGTIGNETWSSSGNVHIVTCATTITGTLIIQAGTIVKFNSGTSLIVNGALRVLGTSGNPVYLTSYRDDAVGGDTDGDGGANSPARGDWTRIQFNASSGASSLIDYAVIRYGGYNSAGIVYGAVNLTSASPTIQNTTLTQNKYCAIAANVNSFPTLSGNTLTSNDANGLCLYGGTIGTNSTWDVTDTSYYVRDNIVIGIGSTLTVTPGVIVKFHSGRELDVNGALHALGTSGNPVYLTSYRDDAVGGDTDGDGGANSPARGDWTRIQFNASSGASSLINYAVIRYGGYNSAGIVYGAVNLTSASPTIQNITLTQNTYAGILAASSTPTLGCNNILDNDYGIRNATTGITVTAKNQWWGSASGPYHPIKNPTGTGDRVSDGVDFNPWRSAACDSTGQYSLTVDKVGTGNGIVTSVPPAIDCGQTCSARFTEGTVVSLTATAQTDSTFVGWSGNPDCSDGQVTMDADKTCTATFTLIPYTLTVTKAGTGSGKVTSNPAGINCGTVCSAIYGHGTVVTLAPVPDTDSTFEGWSGHPDCSDGQVTMDADKTCTATFTRIQHTLVVTIIKVGTGSGKVTSNPAGIDCEPDCSKIYGYGTVVTLTPVPDTDSTFLRWSGHSDCSDGRVTMDADKSCIATFTSFRIYLPVVLKR
jgi:hypothetical protein